MLRSKKTGAVFMLPALAGMAGSDAEQKNREGERFTMSDINTRQLLRSVPVLVALSALVLLAGCSSKLDGLKVYMKCGIAANQLGRNRASEAISQKMKTYIDEHKLEGSARDAMFLAAEVRDEDLQLYKMSNERKYYTLVKLYNSSACRELHGQEKIDLSLLTHYRYYLFYPFM